MDVSLKMRTTRFVPPGHSAVVYFLIAQCGPDRYIVRSGGLDQRRFAAGFAAFITGGTYMRNEVFAFAIFGLLSGLGIARADESKVALSEVPKAGVEAVKSLFPAAEITGAAKET